MRLVNVIHGAMLSSILFSYLKKIRWVVLSILFSLHNCNIYELLTELGSMYF